MNPKKIQTIIVATFRHLLPEIFNVEIFAKQVDANNTSSISHHDGETLGKAGNFNPDHFSTLIIFNPDFFTPMFNYTSVYYLFGNVFETS